MGANSPPFTVFLDFDGTLVEPNVAILVVEEFAPNGRQVARSIDLALKAQKMTLREAWEQEAAALPADRLPEMLDFIRKKAPLRAGARELLALLKKHDIRTTILSGGLDVFMDPVLDREEIDLPILSECATIAPNGGLRVLHPHGHPSCRLCGICKALAVRGAGDGPRTVFIGDGSTDRYGAEVADIVFARHRLLEYCRATAIPCFPFEDFDPVTERMSAWLEGREPIPSPRAIGRAASPCPISQELTHQG
ncbi:MAG: HAD-IB family phosphatase [Thermoplasmata archaeon]|jgi:2-hydroxy-3-keto-5-methylthiopentenyl-1-phosphate phosphatase